jgi:hypothetical protein
MNQPTSVLYPGQSRPDYKPHAGFRYDGTGQTNAVTVVAPMDGIVFRGARFLEGGEIQYTFDLINSCGIMHRVGHLRELTARFQAIADGFPSATEGDSRTTNVSGQTVTAGEAIATAIGFRTTNNRFYDWGVFDLRQRNARSADAAWAAAHPGELAHYALCVFDLLPAGDAARIRSLPAADPTAGRTSDFCR